MTRLLAVPLFTLATFVNISAAQGADALAAAQSPSTTSVANEDLRSTGQEEQSNEDEDEELDSLLDIAEKDVGQLSSVSVAARNAVAPALQTEVSTVSRQKSTVGRSPAAVFVISNTMIRRSGARTIPEALRMVPGVQVAKIDSSKWAVSIRGSNGRFANKLLVQIDGRSVYTPLFGGVFWDVQDVLLEDVDRIEVIRGPGASVWGANAVNGVINVITKSANDTHGMFAEGGIGTEEDGFASARYGWRTAGGIDFRIYGKWFERHQGFVPNGVAHDDWRVGRGGFRADWKPDCCSNVTLQGDTYRGTTGRQNILPSPLPPFSRAVADDAGLAGWNTLFRYSRTLSEDSDWTFQTYYDRTERNFQSLGFREDRDTVDVDFQHRFRWRDYHSVVWGAGYRNSRDRVHDSPFFLSFNPQRRADDLFSYFVQDEVTLLSDLVYLTLGSKFIHTDYTPFELQPTVRLLWTPTERHSVWASYSRAVRAPTRVGDDVRLTLLQNPAAPGAFPLFLGNRGFVAENLDAWELGLRSQPTARFSWDAAMFYFDYDDLQSTVTGAPFFDPGPPAAAFVPLRISNDGEGRSYGIELAVNYEMHPCWHVYGSYSYLREELSPGGTNVGSSPRNQLYLQSSVDLTEQTSLDVIWRYVDNLPAQRTPNYNTIDLRLAWRPTLNLEAAVVGRNLLDADHPEFGLDGFTGNVVTNVQREVYGILSWRY